MNDTTDHTAPAALVETLARLGLSEVLTGYAPRQHVTRRVSWREFERFVEGQGYQIVREDGNLYAKIGVRPAVPITPAPLLRLVTRSDVTAVYGSKRRAA